MRALLRRLARWWRGPATDRGLMALVRIPMARQYGPALYLSLHTELPAHPGNELDTPRQKLLGANVQRAEVYQNRTRIVFPGVLEETSVGAWGLSALPGGPILLEGEVLDQDRPATLRPGTTVQFAPGALIIQMVETS